MSAPPSNRPGRLIKVYRWTAPAVVAAASAILAVQDAAVPPPIRAGAVAVLVAGSALGVPAIRPISTAATKADHPEAAQQIGQAITDAADR